MIVFKETPFPDILHYKSSAGAHKRAVDGVYDYVEDLCIEGGKLFQVLNVISLHGGFASSWAMRRMTAENTVQKMIEHWRAFGLPDYAQFDNSTVFLYENDRFFALKITVRKVELQCVRNIDRTFVDGIHCPI